MIAPDAAAMRSLIKIILSMAKFNETVAEGNSLTFGWFVGFARLDIPSAVRNTGRARADPMTLWNKLKERLASLRGRPALDALLAHANPNHPLAVRLEWAEDLFAWVRRDVPTTRLKLLL
jgi:hypothetical protein